MECSGLLVRLHAEEVVPPGCISFQAKDKPNSDQYAAHPGAVKYCSIVFHQGALLHSLGEQLRLTGYSSQMHEALMEAKRTLTESVVGGQGKIVQLTNRMVNAMGKLDKNKDKATEWEHPDQLKATTAASSARGVAAET